MRAALLLVLLLAPGALAQPQGACPGGVSARSHGDGSIVVSWDALEGAQAYRIHRAAGTAPLRPHALVAEGTSFRDADTHPGASYRYVVSADGADASTCAVVGASSVSYRAGILTALAVLFVALAGYAVVARTRAW